MLSMDKNLALAAVPFRSAATLESDVTPAASYAVTPDVEPILASVTEALSSGESHAWWVWARFGTGKSHLLATIAQLATGGRALWMQLAASDEANWGWLSRYTRSGGDDILVSTRTLTGDVSAGAGPGPTLMQVMEGLIPVPVPSPTDDRESIASAFNRFRIALSRAGYRGWFIILDEVSHFLTAGGSHGRNVAALKYMAEEASRSPDFPVWLVCAGQDLDSQPDTVRSLLANDRFRPVLLSQSDASFRLIINRRLLNGAEHQSAETHQHCADLIRRFAFSNTPDELQQCYPFTPLLIKLTRDAIVTLNTNRTTLELLHQVLQRHSTSGPITASMLMTELEASAWAEVLVSVQAYRSLIRGRTRLQDAPDITPSRRRRMMAILDALGLAALAGHGALTPREVSLLVLESRRPDATGMENTDHYHQLLVQLAHLTPHVQLEPNGCFSFQVDAEERPDPQEVFNKVLHHLGPEAAAEGWAEYLTFESSDVKDLLGATVSLNLDITQLSTAPLRLHALWRGRPVTGQAVLLKMGEGPKTVPPQIRTYKHHMEFVVAVLPEPAGTSIERLASVVERRYLFLEPGELSTQGSELFRQFTAAVKVLRQYGKRDDREALEIVHWCRVFLAKLVLELRNEANARFQRGRLLSGNGHGTLPARYGGSLSEMVQEALPAVFDASYGDLHPPLSGRRPFDTESALQVMRYLIGPGEVVDQAASSEGAVTYGAQLGLLDTNGHTLSIDQCRPAQMMLGVLMEQTKEAAMPVDSIYRLFMMPPYGFSLAMIRVYLLALARMGLVNITVRSRSKAEPAVLHGPMLNVTVSTKWLERWMTVQWAPAPVGGLEGIAQLATALDAAESIEVHARLVTRATDLCYRLDRYQELWTLLAIPLGWPLRIAEDAKSFSCSLKALQRGDMVPLKDWTYRLEVVRAGETWITAAANLWRQYERATTLLLGEGHRIMAALRYLQSSEQLELRTARLTMDAMLRDFGRWQNPSSEFTAGFELAFDALERPVAERYWTEHDQAPGLPGANCTPHRLRGAQFRLTSQCNCGWR